jgi:hypothetical protein
MSTADQARCDAMDLEPRRALASTVDDVVAYGPTGVGGVAERLSVTERRLSD